MSTSSWPAKRRCLDTLTLEVHQEQEEVATTPGRSSHTAAVHKQGRFPSILNRIMAHPELLLAFVSNLTPSSLVNLYAVSKPFHYLFNKHYTTFVLANVRTFCGPESENIFPYWAYKRLCKLDPIRRDMSATTSLEASDLGTNTASPPSNTVAPLLRQVPGIKWLTMVTHRVSVIRQIIAILSMNGLLLPYNATAHMLQKLWFLMDLQSNGMRIGYVHSRDAWTDTDLKVAYFFFTRLDLRFTDPIEGDGSLSMRTLLLRHRSLTPLLETLRRDRHHSQLELVKSVVCFCHGVSQARRGLPVLGLHPTLVGRGEREAHGRGGRRLLRPDQLVMMEMLRRRLNPGELVLPYLLAGRSQMRTLRYLRPIKNAVRRR